MDVLILDVELVTSIIKVIIFILIVSTVISKIFKLTINIFEKYLSMFKFTFYLILALLTYVLNVAVEGKDVLVGIGIPEELTIGQSLLILISLLEALSNFAIIFKVPKSEFHLVQRDDFNEYKMDELSEKGKIYQRIIDLEEELKMIKNTNTIDEK